jgi:hypothetical protein
MLALGTAALLAAALTVLEPSPWHEEAGPDVDGLAGAHARSSGAPSCCPLPRDPQNLYGIVVMTRNGGTIDRSLPNRRAWHRLTRNCRALGWLQLGIDEERSDQGYQSVAYGQWTWEFSGQTAYLDHHKGRPASQYSAYHSTGQRSSATSKWEKPAISINVMNWTLLGLAQDRKFPSRSADHEYEFAAHIDDERHSINAQ